jgi:hypothetical protein
VFGVTVHTDLSATIERRGRYPLISELNPNVVFMIGSRLLLVAGHSTQTNEKAPPCQGSFIIQMHVWNIKQYS